MTGQILVDKLRNLDCENSVYSTRLDVVNKCDLLNMIGVWLLTQIDGRGV